MLLLYLLINFFIFINGSVFCILFEHYYIYKYFPFDDHFEEDWIDYRLNFCYWDEVVNWYDWDFWEEWEQYDRIVEARLNDEVTFMCTYDPMIELPYTNKRGCQIGHILIEEFIEPTDAPREFYVICKWSVIVSFLFWLHKYHTPEQKYIMDSWEILGEITTTFLS